MTSGTWLALKLIACDLAVMTEAPEVGEIESLLVQTQQVWENSEEYAREAGAPTPERINGLLTSARQSLLNGDSAMALEDLRDTVDALRETFPSPASRT